MAARTHTWLNRSTLHQCLPVLASTILLLQPHKTALAAGFQIPNQSVRAVGIAGANIAFTPGPDAAYYNPANLSFLDEGWQLETSLTTLYLPEIEYTDSRSPLLNGTSDSELFFLPQIHLASDKYGNFRFGFSLTYPYGLTKEWDQPYPAASANTFSLFVIEANPSLAYQINERFSIAGGARLVYAEGEVNNRVSDPPFPAISPLTSLSREIDSADDLQAGYNLAATYRPGPAWRVAATYRSEIDLDLEGEATLLALAGGLPVAQYFGRSKLPITLPAVFSLAAAYTYTNLTVELTWNRTFWSAIDDLDFQYDNALHTTVFAPFDLPQPKNWDDSDALRLGLTYRFNGALTAIAGFAIDDTPVPERTLGFELPDSDALMYCLGMEYTTSKGMRFGISYMYHHTTSRTVTTQSSAGIPEIAGSFTDGGAHALTIGLITRF